MGCYRIYFCVFCLLCVYFRTERILGWKVMREIKVYLVILFVEMIEKIGIGEERGFVGFFCFRVESYIFFLEISIYSLDFCGNEYEESFDCEFGLLRI